MFHGGCCFSCIECRSLFWTSTTLINNYSLPCWAVSLVNYASNTPHIHNIYKSSVVFIAAGFFFLAQPVMQIAYGIQIAKVVSSMAPMLSGNIRKRVAVAFLTFVYNLLRLAPKCYGIIQ